MNLQQFKGVGVAIVTPFKNGAVDFDNLERIIEHVIDGGVDYIVALGSTGESVMLNKNECTQIISFIVKKTNNRVPIVAGHFGGNSTGHLIERLENNDFTGVSAIMSSSPSYVKPSQEGIYQHYMAVAEASPLPLIIYNVPGRTSSNVEPATIVRLANDHSKFIAVKDATGSLTQSIEIIKDKPKDFLVLSGDDPTAMAHMLIGGDGIISVIANSIPKAFSNMINAAAAGDLAKAKHLNDLMHDLHHWLYVEGNPVGIKAALEFQDLCSREVRLPLVGMTNDTYQLMTKELEKVLLNIHQVS